MKKNLKDSMFLIIILFVFLTLPFNVDAKQTNTYIRESDFNYDELISGDTVGIDDSIFYTPVEEQNFKYFDRDKVTKFEYYIIDSIDSKGNIEYKKYDFSKSPKSVWNPKSSSVYNTSGYAYDINVDTVEYYNSCNKVDGWMFDSDERDGGLCNIILPAVNGKIVRWRFDGKEYGDKKDIEVCKYKGHFLNDLYSSCDKTQEEPENTYIGTYEYYTSYVYKFYQLPEEKPKVKITCDSNKLTAGKTSKCKVNISYKYGVSNVLFDITSDKFKISNLQIDDFWDSDWTVKKIDNGFSLKYFSDFLLTFDKFESEIATFEVTADEDIDDIVTSLKTSDIKFVEKTGESIASNNSNSGDESVSNDKINNIINPNTFSDSYYLVVAILLIGLICFIQIKSKAKSK